MQVLNYQAHRVLVEQLAALGRSFERALDLGCGTGLCGPLMQADGASGWTAWTCRRNMLAKAQALGVYDAPARRTTWSTILATTGDRYDLVLSADVFIYVGALEAVFDGVARVIEPGGVFCFSVELAPDEQDFVLRPSQRYAHSRALPARAGPAPRLRGPQHAAPPDPRGPAPADPGPVRLPAGWLVAPELRTRQAR